MTVDRHADVVVLGAGLIGPVLALALARHGLRVVLIDRSSLEPRRDPDFDGRAYAVSKGSRNLLLGLGMWDRIEHEAQKILKMEVIDRCPGPASAQPLAFDPAEAGHTQIGWIVEDRFLRNALLDAIADHAGIEVLAPATPRATDHTARAAVTLDDGTTITSALVACCDGRRSDTARAAGIRYLERDYRQTGLVCAISHERPHDGVAHQSFYPGGPFAVLPLTGNRSSLVWSEQAEQARTISALDDEGYLGAVRSRLGGRLGDIALAGRRWAFPLRLALADRYVRPRLAVLGDAAHGVHPIAGQGMNIGLRDVAALSEVLIEASRRGEDIGALDVLERYQRWRRFDASALSLGVDALNRLFSTSSAPAQVLRNAGLGLVARSPGLRRFFMAEAGGTAGAIPRLLAGQSI